MKKFVLSSIFGLLLFGQNAFALTCEETFEADIRSWANACLAGNPNPTCVYAPIFITSTGPYGDNPTLSVNCRRTCTGLPVYETYTGGKRFCDLKIYPEGKKAVQNIPKSSNICGSIVQVEQRVLGESVPIVGASFKMNYFTNWVQGRSGDYKIVAPIAGAIPRDTITSFDADLKINGVSVYSTSFVNNVPNVNFEYLWDGAISSMPTLGSVDYELTILENRPTIVLPVITKQTVGSFKSILLGLGGWLPDNYQFYDVRSGTLFSGNGKTRKVIARPWNTTGFMISEEDGSQVYFFDSTGRIVYTKTGLLGATIFTFNYNLSGQLSSIDETHGRTTTFDRNLGGDFISITAPKGQVTQVSLDANGYVSAFENPNAEIYSMTYFGTLGLLATFTKPGLQTNSFTYDLNGNIIKDTHSGAYYFDIIKNSSALSLDVSTKTRMGFQTRYSGTVNNSYISRTKTYPNGKTDTYSFNPNGAVSAAEAFAQDGITSSVSYSPDKRFAEMSWFPATQSVQYWPVGYNLVKTQTATLSNVNDPFSITAYSLKVQKSNYVITTVFDPSLKKFTSTTNLGRTQETTVDILERPIFFKRGNLTDLEFVYTNENITKIKSGARETDLTYDVTSGFLSSIVNPLGQTTAFTYDSAGRIYAKTLPDLRVIGYGYDGNGNLTQITPPNRPTHNFGFNSSEMPSSYIPPVLSGVVNSNTTYTYDNDKKITQILRPTGAAINYNYSLSNGILTSVTSAAGAYNITTNTTNNLPSAIDNVGGLKMYLYYAGRTPNRYTTYNPSWGTISDMTITLSALGLKSSETVGAPGGTSSISYTYDNDELLATAGSLSLTHDTPNGMLTGTAIGTSPNNVTDAYTYNTFGEITGYEVKYGATTIYQLTLGRDASGRVNSKSQTMNSTTDAYDYDFDVAGRLTQTDKNSVTVATYGYDDNSNRNSGTIGGQATAATYDDQDRMTAYNVLTFAYNANGEMTGKTNTLLSTTTSYTYDVFGNLTSMTLPSAAVITYEIDGLNRRIGKKLNGTLQKRWVYMDQTRIAAELDASGAITKRFVYASKSNIPDYMIMGGVNHRIISDHLGSPRLVVKVSDGTITGMMDHDEYGRVVVDTNPGLLPFGFAGGLYDPDTGLNRYGARDYDPETGRWTAKDPILFGGGDTNLYGYTWNDPVNFIDPSGKAVPVIVVWTAGGAVAGGLGASVGTLIGGGSFGDAAKAFVPGAIGGALAGATAGASVIVGGATALGTGLGIAVDLLYTGINAIDAVSGPTPVLDVSSGVNAIQNGKKCP